jgi:uncharacterized RDD family membrane protein YckC
MTDTVRSRRRGRTVAGSSSARRGPAATAFGLGAGIGRVVLLPGRVLAGSFLVAPVLKSARNSLASAGRDAEARGRRRLETTAAGILAAPETVRTLDRALAGPVPEVLGDETIERLAQRLLESPAFERIVRDVAESQVVRDLTEEAVHSAELQRALEEVLAGPALRNALERQTRTLWSEVAARVRHSADRLDAAVERAVRRALRRRPRTIAPAVAERRYAGLVSRGAALLADAGITQLAVLVVGSLVGLFASVVGLSAPGWLAATLAGAGWVLFVGGYFVLFWATVGQTPGMRMLGLRVTREDGAPPQAGRSLLRFAAALLAIAPLGAGFLPVLFDGRRRALQDFVARTVVVRADASERGSV